jgi:glycosyltransferase involved in cell wall biosynthesis
MNMRILVMIDAFTYGGAQKVLLTLVPEWVKAGCEIQIMLIQDSAREMQLKSLEDLGVRVHRVSAKNMFDFRAMATVIGIARKLKPTHVQAHLYWAQIWGVLARFSVVGSKLFWVEHNTYFNRSDSQWFLYRVMSRFAYRIISVSHEVQRFLDSKHVGPTEVILNPISHNFVYKPEIERTFTFVFLGRLNDQKNPRLAIEAFEFAKVNKLIDKNAKLVIGGEGPLLGSLRSFVLELDSKESITFAGQLTELQTVNLLQSSISLVSTSEFEGFSLVRVEALATGATVISTRTGGMMGILTISPNSDQLLSGVILTEPEVVEIANAMSTVSDPVFWTDFSIYERVKSAERHGPKKIADDYLVSFNKTDLIEDLG